MENNDVLNSSSTASTLVAKTNSSHPPMNSTPGSQRDSQRHWQHIMDEQTYRVLTLVVPRLPMLLKTALLHTLWLSPTSSKWDLRTELIISFFRNYMASPPSRPLTAVQRVTTKQSPVKGPLWIARTEIPPPESQDEQDALIDLLCHAIDDLCQGNETYTRPTLASVSGEWTGWRKDADAKTPEPQITEPEKFSRLMADKTTETTVLYIHGGAFWLCDPATHRPATSTLARLTGARVFSLRYRLSPQAAFPAALLDCLLAYLSLLYPPSGSLHAPVDPAHLVIAGESAGGNLVLTLYQLLLHLHRQSQAHVCLHGEKQPIPLPAAIVALSPWLDLTRSLPSLEANTPYDYLPPPSAAPPRFPPDAAWPADPPRGDMYCDLSAVCHPLVSPLAALDWSLPASGPALPPIFLNSGQELLADEIRVLAARLAGPRTAMPLRWEQFEAMPHAFAHVLPNLPQSARAWCGVSAFVREAVGGEQPVQGVRGRWFPVEAFRREAAEEVEGDEVDVAGLAGEWTDERVLRRMRKAREFRVGRKEGGVKIGAKI